MFCFYLKLDSFFWSKINSSLHHLIILEIQNTLYSTRQSPGAHNLLGFVRGFACDAQLVCEMHVLTGDAIMGTVGVRGLSLQKQRLPDMCVLFRLQISRQPRNDERIVQCEKIEITIGIDTQSNGFRMQIGGP